MANPKFLRISIDDPCHVPWDGMTPVDKERKHCSSCDRVITDFSTMSDDELMLFFTHSTGKICGRFARHQLDRPMPLLPQKTQPAKWWRTLLLLPLTLFGKSARAQNDSAAQVMTRDTLVVNADSLAAETLPQDSTVVSTLADTAVGVNVDREETDTSDHRTKPAHHDVVFVTVTGTMIQTLGYCTPQTGDYELFPAPNYPDLFQAITPMPDEQQVYSADSAFQNVTTENPQKPAEPQAPAQQPASTDLSAVLPEKRRRFWRS